MELARRLFPPELTNAVEPLDVFQEAQFGLSPCNHTGAEQRLASGPALRFALIRDEYRGATGTGSAIWFYRACLLGAFLVNRTLVSGFCHAPTCPLREWGSCGGSDLDALTAWAANNSVTVDVEECAWSAPATMVPESSRRHYWGSKDTAFELAARLTPEQRTRFGGQRVETLLFWRIMGMSYFLRLNVEYDAQFGSLSRWQRPDIWPEGQKVATFHIRHDDKDPWEGRQVRKQVLVRKRYHLKIQL